MKGGNQTMEDNKSISTPTIPTNYSVLNMTILEDQILEVGIIKIRNGHPIAKYLGYIKPNKEINDQRLKNIKVTSEQLSNAEDLDVIIPRILNIIGNDTLIYMNDEKKLELLKSNCENLGIQFNNDTIRGTSLLSVIPVNLRGLICNSLELLIEF